MHSELATVIQPGGWLQRHFHSFEESLYVLEGELLMELDGRTHGSRRETSCSCRWASGMRWATLARSLGCGCSPSLPQRLAADAGRQDTFFATEPFDRRLDAAAERPPLATRACAGSATTTARRPVEALALGGPAAAASVGATRRWSCTAGSASRCWSTASSLELLTMFTVDYEPGGSAQVHDHPFEETYFFLDGEIEAELDGQVRACARR